MQKNWLATLNVKVKGLYNQNMTAGPFAYKLGMLVQHHKPECSVGKCDYCIQGQGHSKG